MASLSEIPGVWCSPPFVTFCHFCTRAHYAIVLLFSRVLGTI
jgi:hypothetical protein